MASRAEHTRTSRGARLALLLAAIVAVGGLVAVASASRVDSPHGKFKEDCSLCHVSKSWKDVQVSKSFDHAKYGFPLTGAHATSDCMGCHQSLEFAQSRTQCASCHADPHRGEMGTACARCHGARSFIDRGPMVRAHQLTRFPLTGTHASLDCESCHKPAAQGQLQFVGTQAECSACHMAQYNATTDPNHQTSGFSTKCQTCHVPITWRGGAFDHAQTGFPLTGAHRQTACSSCHTGGGFKGLDPACYACHAATYSAASPPHTAASFPPAACGTCHSTTSWSTPFDHSKTSFPLTGAHVGPACTACHGDGVYAGKSTACYSCHTVQYNAATPPHTPAAYPPNACGTCHDTVTWTNANFDHSKTSFPLTGAHVGQACTACHGDGVYAGKSTACYSCHAATYASASPAHTEAFYPSAQCGTCHNTSSWSGGRISSHDASWFRIYSGKHNGRWSACADCHTSPSNPAVFTCIACHTHSNQGNTDQQHQGVGGYSFTATSCYSCHRSV